tara:strand:- start:18 stop:503 length:486 start_codon:yes stop_codon:yes gene_type:complete
LFDFKKVFKIRLDRFECILNAVLIRKYLNRNQEGFTLVELIVVIVILLILGSISIPSFLNIIEKVEAQAAQLNLMNAFEECSTKILFGEQNPTYSIPPNTSRFQYPDSGKDGYCLSPSSGNILTAARTAYGQRVSTYNLNINVVTGAKSTERSVPSWINWQ